MMNCEHQGEGWCLACVRRLGEENETLRQSNRKSEALKRQLFKLLECGSSGRIVEEVQKLAARAARKEPNNGPGTSSPTE